MADFTLSAALLIGLLGSSHCLGMCGGLSSALTVSKGASQRSFLFTYNLGRILTYASIGALAGLLGEQMLESLPQLGLVLRILAASLLIAMGLYVTQWWMGLTYLEKGGAYLWRYIQPLTKKMLPVDSHIKVFVLGALWGLLPCGLVYSTLSFALTMANWQQSALFMFAFGLGTLPAMLSVGLVSERFLSLLRKKNFRVFAGMLIIVMGLVTAFIPWLHSHHGAVHDGSSNEMQHHDHSAH